MIRSLTSRVVLCAMLATLLTSALPATMSAQEETPPSDSESELASQLPAVDLPTMNEMSYTFDLESSWNGAGNTPQELPVYQYEARTYTEEEVQDISDRLGVGGEVTSQGEGTYTVEGDGSVFTTPGLLQFVSNVEPPDEAVPGDEEAVAFASEWLRITNLLPANSDNGAVIARIESPAQKIVAFKPASPSPLLSTNPGITVTVGPGGTILQARISWATIQQGDVYRLRGVEDGFGMVATRQSYIDVTLPEDEFPQGSTITGHAAYDDVSIVYATSGVQGETQYLQPVYRFTGTFTPEGSDETFDITSYVPAIVTSLQPVG